MTIGNGCRILVLSFCAVMAGCATSRSEILLQDPTPVASDVAAGTKGTVVIRTVKDERVFEQAPKDASIPSLGFEGADKATAELKARAVGRKRNGYGKALGDVVLKEGQTVEGVIRDNVAAALRSAGFKVADANEVVSGTPVTLDIHIRKFWAWLQPGFWVLAIHTKIATEIDIGSGQPTTIEVAAVNRSPAAPEGMWTATISKALTNFRTEVAAKIPSVAVAAASQPANR
jgi:uncharacterized lipoprotein YajG